MLMNLYLRKRKKLFHKLLVGTTLFAVGGALLFILALIPQKYFPVSWLSDSRMVLLIMSVTCILVYKPIDGAYTKLLRLFVFKQKSYRHITLMNLTEDLSLILDLKELGNLIVNTFGEVMQLKTVALVVPSAMRGDFEIVSAYGWNLALSRKVRLPGDSLLIDLIREGGPHVMVRERVVRTLSWQEANQVTHDFDQLHSSWIIPLYVKNELTGMIAFSSFVPDTAFDETDFLFFRDFARTTAKFVHNALSMRELKQTNEELQDIQSQLIQNTKISAIEQLATGIAHEIHNPLTIISGKAQVLLLKKDRSEISQEQIEDVLKTVVKQTKRAADITKKLLMFSQGSGAPKEVLNLAQVLEDTIALVSYQTSLDGIEIRKVIANDLPAFYANVHEIREVFLNLLLNAVQSIGSQGKIEIDMFFDPVDELIEIKFADTGKGIDPEHIDKLFNPFFTTRHESVGLGLFVTKQIVHRYGGLIRGESRGGEGCVFTVRFPYIASAQPMSREDKKGSLSLFPESR